MAEFVKLHGCGNDYLFIDCLDREPPADPSLLSRRMSDRHFGAGADGLVLILPPETDAALCRMRIFNSDGSEAEMCGNAIRCLAKLVYESGRIVQERMLVETGAGLRSLELEVVQGKIPRVRVDMGPPGFGPEETGVRLDNSCTVEYPLAVKDQKFRITCVSMGNPHAVIFLKEPVEDFPVRHFGPLIENHQLFPNRTNVEFVNVRGANTLRQRTWERGSGETLACGTGASAAAVASILTGRSSPGKVEVVLNGGTLEIHWREGENVFMTGPAEKVYTGCWPD
ncbi:MAG TPA: diaminopimelate epimerase [archaeon]|nr:diaminopimelate epimerase [archaeon]